MKKLNLKPKAIIFDMDGVIVDSMPYHFLAWYEALRPLGVRVSCFDVFSREGERWDKTLKELLMQNNIKPKKVILKRIFAQRQKIFRKYFKRFIFMGAQGLLTCLKKQGYYLGLATGTPTYEIEKILPKKIKDLFDCIVAGNQVINGKPHPETYLKAAQAIKAKPSECIVVENAPLGIESAKRAAIFCIAITTSLPKEYLRKADIVTDSLDKIPSIIGQSCRI